MKDCWLSRARTSRLYSASYCRIAHTEPLRNDDSLSPQLRSQHFEQHVLQAPGHRVSVILSHVRLQCHDSSTLFQSSGCLVSSHHRSSLVTIIILVHLPTFAAVHHINHRQSLFSYNFTIVNLNQPPPSWPSLIQHLNYPTTTSHTLVIHHLLNVGSLLRLVHRHRSQHCASHQKLSPAYSTCEHRTTQLLTSFRPSLQPDLQHASIHAPSCIVVRESPCSRCFIVHRPVHWEGSTVAAGHQPSHHDEAMLQ